MNCENKYQKYIEEKSVYIKAHGNTILPDVTPVEEFYKKFDEQSIELGNRIVLLTSKLAEPTYFGTIEQYVKLNAEKLLTVSCSSRDNIQFTKDLEEEMGDPGTLQISFHTATMTDMTLNFFFDSVGDAESPTFLYQSGITTYAKKDSFLMDNFVSFTPSKWEAFKNSEVQSVAILKMVFDNIIWEYCLCDKHNPWKSGDEIEDHGRDEVLDGIMAAMKIEKDRMKRNEMNKVEDPSDDIQSLNKDDVPDYSEAEWQPELVEATGDVFSGVLRPSLNRQLGEWFYKYYEIILGRQTTEFGYPKVADLLTTTLSEILKYANLVPADALIVLLACRTSYSTNPAIPKLRDLENAKVDPKRILDSALEDDRCPSKICGAGVSDELPRSCRERGCYECAENDRCTSCRDNDVITIECPNISICLSIPEVSDILNNKSQNVPFVSDCVIPQQTLAACKFWLDKDPSAQAATIGAFQDALYAQEDPENNNPRETLAVLQREFFSYMTNVVNTFKYLPRAALLECWNGTMKPVLETYIQKKLSILLDNKVSSMKRPRGSWGNDEDGGGKRPKYETKHETKSYFLRYLDYLCPNWRYYLSEPEKFSCLENTVGYIIFSAKILDDILNSADKSRKEYITVLESFLVLFS